MIDRDWLLTLLHIHTMVSQSTSLKPFSPFSSTLIREQQLKHNPNNLLFISYNKPNSNFPFPKRLVVSQQKSTFIAKGVPKDTTKTNEESNLKILSPEVLRQDRAFSERKWNYWDVSRAIGIFGVHFLSLFAPFHFNWQAFRVAVGLSFIAGTGITLSYHRNLSHRSFTLPKWLEYLFAWCGTLAFQV